MLFKVNPESIYEVKIFAPNEFPYNSDGNHSIMWYGGIDQSQIKENEVNEDIFQNLEKQLGHVNFEFAWYENPKMTIPQIYHVQVFWIDHTFNSQQNES